jgi:hypothetical protein
MPEPGTAKTVPWAEARRRIHAAAAVALAPEHLEEALALAGRHNAKPTSCAPAEIDGFDPSTSRGFSPTEDDGS